MYHLLTYLLDTFDTFTTYLSHLSIRTISNTYWFLFFVEFPRYYLLDIVVIGWMSFSRNSRYRERRIARYRLYKENPLVTILVPGKNEGKNIFKLVTSLKEQTYRNYEIVVVDDGSDDNTEIICENLVKREFITRYLRLVSRGGKASAANYGVSMSKGKYIVALDADSSLDYDCIENMLLPFYLDSQVKAVGGCIKVRNNKETICSSMQALEYLKTIMVGRTVSSWLGIYHIISGACGAFEAETMRRVGCWDIGPGLDGDLTQKIRKAGYKVKFTNDAICMTNVPTKWRKLWKQRIRWSRSLIRFRLRKHRDILLPTRNWMVLNWVSNMENLMYDCFLNFLWVFYIINLIFTYNEHILEVFILGLFIRVILGYMSWGIIMLTTERRAEEAFLFKYVPLKTFYVGYFLRICRLVAHTQELFFFSSYKDNWNPPKTSRYAMLNHS